jgi:hypothetical protein
MVDTSKVNKEFTVIKNSVIGIFKSKYLNKFQLIVDHSDKSQTLSLVSISDFGAVSREYGIPKKYGIVKLFEKGKNMNDMLSDPFEFQKFMETFKD